MASQRRSSAAVGEVVEHAGQISSSVGVVDRVGGGGVGPRAFARHAVVPVDFVRGGVDVLLPRVGVIVVIGGGASIAVYWFCPPRRARVLVLVKQFARNRVFEFFPSHLWRRAACAGVAL